MAQLKTKILLLNGSQQDWTDLKDYVLSPGEPAVEFVPNVGSQENPITAVKIKVGDGFTTYEKLPYIGEHLVGEFTTKFNELEAAINASGNAVFQIDAENLKDLAGATEGEKIGVYTANLISQTEGAQINEGNIAIVKKAINEEFTDSKGNLIPVHYSYTAYVYKGSVWAAMDGNYNAENVYFNDDITFTTNIGTLKLASGKTQGTFETKGKSLEDVLKGLLQKTEAPTITQPSFSLTANASSNTSAASKEIGSYITKLSWAGTFTDGTYSYGYKNGTGTSNKNAGCTATYDTSYKVLNDKGEFINGSSSIADTEDGTITLGETEKLQISSTSETTYAKITNKCTWSDSPREPINNLGDVVAGQITSNSSEKTASINVTGYRNSFYYVGTDDTTPLDGAFIRSSTPKDANTKVFNITTGADSHLPIAQGTKRIVIAIPGTATLKEVKHIDGFGSDVKGNFDTLKIRVKGANDFVSAAAKNIADTEANKDDFGVPETASGYLYTVFVHENPNGMASAKYQFTIE